MQREVAIALTEKTEKNKGVWKTRENGQGEDASDPDQTCGRFVSFLLDVALPFTQLDPPNTQKYSNLGS